MRRRALVWCSAALAAGALVGGVTIVALVAKERDDRFCVACHLHERKFERFTGVPFTDLTAPHHAKDVRCIDCHGGADVRMRVHVWSVAAVDTARYFMGRAREPERMTITLRAKECSQCHTPILKRTAGVTSAEAEEAAEGRESNAYHAIRPHDAVRVNCIVCHPAHTTDGDPKGQFIARARVQPVCRDCHKTLGE